MNSLEPIVKESAAWMWSKKDEPDWWTYLVLTAENPDASNPNLTRGRAFQVFTVLEERRLIVPITVHDSNGRAFPAYKINFNKEKEWNQLIAKNSFWSLYFIPGVLWLWRKLWLLIIAAFALVLTSFGQAFFNKAGEATFESLFPPKKQQSEQDGGGQPATRPESK
jgi:hypothetical protein